MGYQVAVTPLQMARGGQFHRQRRRVRRAARGPGHIPRRPAIHRAAEDRTAQRQRRHRGDADRHHGRGRRARHGNRRADSGSRSREKPARRAKLINGRYSSTRIQRVVRRVPSVARSGRRHHRGDRFAHGKGYYGGVVSAPIFKQIAEAARGTGASVPRSTFGAGARRARPGDDGRRVVARRGNSPTVSLVADGPPGTVPNCART